MADEIASASGAEEYVTAEIELEDVLDPEQEKYLRDSIGKIDPKPSSPGILHRVRFPFARIQGAQIWNRSLA
jgi:hypothetical protein